MQQRFNGTNGRTAVGNNDQAARLRITAAAASGRALTIAVVSGKGGVGKTNVAVNLSVMLASRGLRVTLVDLDLGLANADLLLDLRPRYNLSHVLSGLRRIRDVGTPGPHRLRFIAGASGVGRLANLSEFERHRLVAQINELRGDADFVIVDCGAGVARNIVETALAADLVMVVTTPEPTALTDAYALTKVLVQERCAGTISVLVNMAASSVEASAAHQRLADVADKFLRFPVANAGYLLQDTHVETAVRQRCPFVVCYPRCPASACVGAVVEALTSGRNGHGAPDGWLGRVAGLFV